MGAEGRELMEERKVCVCVCERKREREREREMERERERGTCHISHTCGMSAVEHFVS